MPLVSYIPQVVGGGALMLGSFMMGKMNYSVLWVGVFIGLHFVKSKLWKARQKRELALQATARMEKQIVLAELENKLQDLPAWVQFPDTERVEWLNKMILQLWPFIGDYTKTFLKENIEPVVRQNLPSAFKSFKFVSMDMGDIPMRMGGIKVYTDNVGRDRVIMDMDVAYAGDCEFVVGVGGFRGGLNSLQVKGKLRCILTPLLPKPPLVGGITAHFLDAPTVDFNLTGLGEMIELPGLFGAVRSVVVDQIGQICVLPNSIKIPLVENVDPVKLYFPEPDGVVRIHLVAAKNLENKDVSFIKKGKSDPYCEINVGSQAFRSKVIDNDLNPTFNEVYEGIVDEADGQKIIVELFDEDPDNRDDELGRAVIALDSIRSKGAEDAWYPLENAKHGDVHLKLYWLSLSDDTADLQKSRHEAQQWDMQWAGSDMTLSCAVLLVYIDSAEDLPSIKRDLEPSPYIEIKVGNRVVRTYAKQKTRNPVYQEKFQFLLDDPSNQDMHVEAKNEGSDRSLGTLDLPVKVCLGENGMFIEQQAFRLSHGAHASPLIMSLRLRAFTTKAPDASGHAAQLKSTLGGGDQ